ncbi:MAG: energy-coupling factor transporter transmembrane component T, partial [Clostridiales bacterium]
MVRKVGSGAFATYHPLVNFVYFAFVLLYAMFFLHPVCLVISLICAFAYSIKLKGAKARRFNFIFLLPMLLVCALINPAFNHEGATILIYLTNGNPLTLESIIYGIVAATMLISMIAWFSCYNMVMTADKFIYLFGRVIPALSLIVSMALRFVPCFTKQAKIIADAQRCIGRDISTGSLFQRGRQAMRIISILITWALENAIETADSMRSR